MGDRLQKGEKLERGQSLTSRNGAYTLTLQDDGNLVLAARGQAVWATDTRTTEQARDVRRRRMRLILCARLLSRSSCSVSWSGT